MDAANYQSYWKNEDISFSKLPSLPKGKKIKSVEVTVSVANGYHNQKSQK